MKKDYAHITFVLDNSGSMEHLISETIAGYNSFIKKQKEVPGLATFSLYQFLINPNEGPEVEISIPLPYYNQINPIIINGHTPHDILYHAQKYKLPVRTSYEFADLKSVPKLSTKNYKCDCYTPLLDAIGYAVETTGERLAAMKEEDRPEKVIFVILTDGEENSSIKYNRAKIKELISHQTDVYKWEFIFLGANIDAVSTGTSFGISAQSSVNYAASGASVTSSYNAISDAVIATRSLGVSVSSTLDDNLIRQAIFSGTYDSPQKTGTN